MLPGLLEGVLEVRVQVVRVIDIHAHGDNLRLRLPGLFGELVLVDLFVEVRVGEQLKGLNGVVPVPCVPLALSLQGKVEKESLEAGQAWLASEDPPAEEGDEIGLHGLAQARDFFSRSTFSACSRSILEYSS